MRSGEVMGRGQVNPVIERLLANGEFTHRADRYPIAHSTAADVCRRYAQIIVEQGARHALEIGTLFGFSTLFIADAMAEVDGHLDTIDVRYRKRTWIDGREIEDIHEVAERLVEEAGLTNRVTFHVGHSAGVLPQLIEAGKKYDFALIDGGHQFEVAMLDFICVDQMLNVGGYVALDDVGPNVSAKQGLSGGPNRVLATVFSTDRYRIDLWSANVAMCRKLRDV
jgi:predicted O-methyltransferase YrrM